MHEALSDKQFGAAEAAENAEYLKGEVYQAFRDLYRAAPQASDAEIAAQAPRSPVGTRRVSLASGRSPYG